jgi:chromosome segregation ATPase
MAAHPDIPEAVLQRYFECQAAPTVADLQDALGCDEEHATGWQLVLQIRLIHPGHYGDLFAAEDVLAERRQQQQRFQDDCHDTAQRLQELQQQLEATTAYAYSLSDAEEQAEVEAKREALDEARVTLLRHQSDLPGAGRLIEHDLAQARSALSAAQETLKAVQVDALTQVEETWLHELRAALEPAVLLLTQAQWLSARWQQLGVEPGHAHGRQRLLDAALHHLRR